MIIIVPITVHDKLVPKNDRKLYSRVVYAHMDVDLNITIKEVKKNFVKMYKEVIGIDFSDRDIHVVIKGRRPGDMETCEDYEVHSSTNIEFHVSQPKHH